MPVVVLLGMLGVIILSSTGLLKAVGTICHLMDVVDLNLSLRRPSPYEYLRLLELVGDLGLR